MDHFEGLICTLLEAEGYWLRRSFKVNVSKEEKRAIGKHSMPRPEIDILAFSFSKNTVAAVEVKSYLDSPGLKLDELQLEHDFPEGRYKLFTAERYRSIVLARLKQDLIDCGMANVRTKVVLGLAVGKIYQKRTKEVREFTRSRGMFFWSPEEIKEKVKALANRSYENDPAIMVAKVLLR
ncbi:hypothetical protein N5J06_19985 [Ralstonia sp. CHL-2022]|uniref:NERD domain-containing protein n=1 Tax=Ralstonia mojiangensis TaxID=2953895 RepID=A0ABT2LCX8_9RALS|nr:hypothetical protein [Ralstonia mojiangensis]MCT7313260.1 hypothetical protein [Ralstonia mojiangensis]